jgi:hypothetical protein
MRIPRSLGNTRVNYHIFLAGFLVAKAVKAKSGVATIPATKP